MPQARTAGLFVVLAIVSHVIVPVGFAVQLARVRTDNLLGWFGAFFLAATYVSFIFIAGAWSWFGRTLRFLLPLLVVAAAVVSFPETPDPVRPVDLAGVEPLLALGIGLVFLWLTVKAMRGHAVRLPALDLAFPFREGSYIVAQGGSTGIVNIHAENPSQRFALDILKLNAAGLRGKGFFPADPVKYAIFGAEIVSPCDGVVVAAQDGFPDLRPPQRDPEHPAGNFVAIEHAGSIVYLAHLQKGSLCVGQGERVTVGQLLARAGNSGNTTEPHLHIHAEEAPYRGHFSGNPGVPLRFQGRFLARNDRVTVFRDPAN